MTCEELPAGIMGFSKNDLLDISYMLIGYANAFECIYRGNERVPARRPEISNPEGKYIEVYTKEGDRILALAERVRRIANE